MNRYMEFSPDVIVEATSVCDRSCKGCYAPNVVTKENISKLFNERPELFLSKQNLSGVLGSIGFKFSIASIRGGEPTRHPELSSLISVLGQVTNAIYLETHGRWIQEKTEEARILLDVCRAERVVLKISFDEMHGLNRFALRNITEFLDTSIVEYVIAITEPDEESFERTRATCSWVPNSKIVFQRKVSAAIRLIHPRIGVIRVDGTFSPTFSTKESFSMQSKAGKGIEVGT